MYVKCQYTLHTSNKKLEVRNARKVLQFKDTQPQPVSANEKF